MKRKRKLLMPKETVPAWAVPIEGLKEQIKSLTQTEKDHHTDLVERLEKIDKNLDGRLTLVEESLQKKLSAESFGNFINDQHKDLVVKTDNIKTQIQKVEDRVNFNVKLFWFCFAGLIAIGGYVFYLMIDHIIHSQ